jgi:4-diphosphocytidyl-2-C-methyl-D-erythritol kinase
MPRARSSVVTSIFHSFAKINLALEVVGRRADGYHQLRTIFQTIDLADVIELTPLAGEAEIELEVSGAALPADESNLAWRAAHAFLERWGREGEGVAIRLEKRIPTGGGLGGGSANAATVLLGLAQLFGRGAESGELQELARRLGADVPFFLHGGSALGLGRGDEIVPLDDPTAGESEIHLIVPPWPLATPAVFAALDASSLDSSRVEDPALAAASAGGAVDRHERWIGRNDLETPAFRVRPEQGALYTALDRSGARVVRMSGSGSAFFALYDDPAAAGEARGHLPPGTVWQKVSTLGRAAWRQASGFGANVGAPVGGI